jgi:hypothetical protein
MNIIKLFFHKAEALLAGRSKKSDHPPLYRLRSNRKNCPAGHACLGKRGHSRWRATEDRRVRVDSAAASVSSVRRMPR